MDKIKNIYFKDRNAKANEQLYLLNRCKKLLFEKYLNLYESKNDNSHFKGKFVRNDSNNYLDIDNIKVYNKQFEYEFLDYLFGENFKKFKYLSTTRHVLFALYSLLIIFIFLFGLSLVSLNTWIMVFSEILIVTLLLVIMWYLKQEKIYFKDESKSSFELRLACEALEKFNISNQKAVNYLINLLNWHLKDIHRIQRSITTFLSIVLSVILSYILDNINTIANFLENSINNEEWWTFLIKDWVNYDTGFVYFPVIFLIVLLILIGLILFLCPYLLPFKDSFIFQNGIRILQQEEMYFYINE